METPMMRATGNSFATGCRVEAIGVMQEAGMRVDVATFLGDIVSPTK